MSGKACLNQFSTVTKLLKQRTLEDRLRSSNQMVSSCRFSSRHLMVIAFSTRLLNLSVRKRRKHLLNCFRRVMTLMLGMESRLHHILWIRRIQTRPTTSLHFQSQGAFQESTPRTIPPKFPAKVLSQNLTAQMNFLTHPEIAKYKASSRHQVSAERNRIRDNR